MGTHADLAIAELNRLGHGAFSRAEALAAGHSPKSIRYRLEVGLWERLYPTVYSIAGSPEAWMRNQSAACKWMKGVASHRAAGHLWELPGCEKTPIEVLTATNNVMPHTGVRVHRTKRLPESQATVVDRIPCTTIERTLMDLCGHFGDRRGSAIAVDDALRRGLTTLGALDHCLYLTARRGRNGCGVLRKIVHSRMRTSVPPHSPLESVIYDVIERSHLPMPRLQLTIRDSHGAFIARPDFVYLDEKLVVQGHSKKWHWGEAAESKDLDQHNRLGALGFRIIYVTWADATRYPDHLVATIDAHLRVAA
jgi:hypothetical protein